MALIITRSKSRAEISGKRLSEKGYQSFIAPMIRQTPTSIPRHNRKWITKIAKNTVSENLLDKSHNKKEQYSKLQAFIFTSLNAFQYLPDEILELNNTIIYTVGSRTASIAREKGFSNILNAKSNVDGLYSLILNTASQKLGYLIHFSGNPIAKDLIYPLKQEGFQAIRYQVYQSHRVEILPDLIRDRVMQEKEDTYLFYSPLVARTFKTLIGKEFAFRKAESEKTGNSWLISLKTGKSYLSKISAITISETVTKELPTIFNSVYTANRPEEDSMFSFLRSG